MSLSVIRSRTTTGKLRIVLTALSVGVTAAALSVVMRSGAASEPLLRLSALPTSGLVTDMGCAKPESPNAVTCRSKVRALLSSTGVLSPLATAGPTGYGPDDLQSAYRLAGLRSTGTVAIVDAYDDPKAESDLAVYRSTFGLSPCTGANGCFRKINQNGATSPLPKPDYGWAGEISLDLDMVSATCPTCRILLVEANSASDADIAAAEKTAAAQPGVVAISNSFGRPEDSSILKLDAAFHHPGIAITASSGDGGYGVSWPASSPGVTGVGGTTLVKAANSRGWAEAAWSGAGSGCSRYEAKPAWQTDAGCARRTVADVAAVADPNTGVAVYDTANNCSSAALCNVLLSLGVAQGANGWIQVGGTSAGAPIIASVFALAGNTSSISPAYPYAHTNALFDVTSGSNGRCSGSYLCTAKPGYDGPTGLGTPNGVGAF